MQFGQGGWLPPARVSILWEVGSGQHMQVADREAAAGGLQGRSDPWRRRICDHVLSQGLLPQRLALLTTFPSSSQQDLRPPSPFCAGPAGPSRC